MIREDEFSHRLNKNANFCGFTPLHYASLIDSYEGVKLLLQEGTLFFKRFLGLKARDMPVTGTSIR